MGAIGSRNNRDGNNGNSYGSVIGGGKTGAVYNSQNNELKENFW